MPASSVAQGSAAGMYSVASPFSAPTAMPRLTSSGRSRAKRAMRAGCGSMLTPRQPRSYSARVTESSVGSYAPTST